MQQIYHSNAKTNVNNREQIQKCTSASNEELATRFNVSNQTVSKWRNRDFVQDASCCPRNIKYALTELETALVISIRRSSWLPLDEVYEMLLEQNIAISRISVYRCLVKNGINKVPQEQKDKAKKFKAYQPGYLHIDVTYLPKFNGKSAYLFVAIDRATRTLYYEIYDDKTAKSTEDFFDKCLEFFPFVITHILTDNGLEFTNRLIMSKKGNLCTKDSLLDIKCNENQIEHRLTKPATPKTNGMVERVNGTIKNNTILKNEYKDKSQMNDDLIQFLIYYNLYRRHGSIRKELNVKTPFQAVEKWFILKPEIFRVSPEEFKNKILNLNQNKVNLYQQPCET
ncbi:MAG: transposase family protein [Erysipelotrichia bacterium]|nr:transposase family protein [Erysipelotrichia bacterium]